MTSTRPVITGPGLKKQGVVVLQILLISLFTFIELTLRSGPGILTGLVIVVTTFGGIRFGRPGASPMTRSQPGWAMATVADAARSNISCRTISATRPRWARSRASS